MRRKILFSLILLFQTVLCHAQVWEKAQVIGNDNNIIWLILDKSSNNHVYYCADFSIDNLQIGDTTIASSGKKDFVLIKATPDLKILQFRQFGGIGQDLVSNITTDQKHNIYISGYFTDSIQFDDLALKSNGGSDAFILKIDSNFNVLWAQSFGSEINDALSIGWGGVICDQENNVHVVGTFGDGFYKSPFLVNDSSFNGFGTRDAFHLEFKEDGELINTSIFGLNNNSIYTRNVSIDTNNDLFFTFNSTSSLQFKDLKFRNPYSGHTAFLVKTSNDGQTLKWVFPFYNMEFGTIDISSIATSNQGDTYVVGNYYCKAIQIGNGSKRFIDDFWLNGTEMFIAKIDSKGNLIWAFNAGGGQNDEVADVDILTNNRIVITGCYTERCFYNGDTIGFIGQSERNGFVLEIDSNGTPNYFATVGKTGFIEMNSIKALDNGNVIVSGLSGAGQLRFDGLDPITITNKNTRFLAKGNLNNETVSVGNDLSKANAVELVYPNPFYDELMLHCAPSQLNSRYRITDVNGKLYAKDRLINNTTIIKTTSWPSGIYFLEIMAEDGSKTQTKIIKIL